MSDRDLDERLRAWYRDTVGEDESAPLELRERITVIPITTPARPRPVSNRRNLTLLAAAAVLVVGGGMAAGSELFRRTALVTPDPSDALVATASPVSPSTAPPAIVRNGDLIAFTRAVQKVTSCSFQEIVCPVPRVWVVGVDGRNAHELVADGVGYQWVGAWSPDGSGLMYSADQANYLADPRAGQPQLVDTGCRPTTPPTPLSCYLDWQVAFARDGRQIVFVRESTDDAGNAAVSAIATMDLDSGQIRQLTSTSPVGGRRPGWSPDGTQIVFSRFGSKDDGGPTPRVMAGVFVVDADGENLRQVSPSTMDAVGAAWSPDGGRIVFVSPSAGQADDVGNLYTIGPDGTDLRQLTTDGVASAPSWTPDGRILFTRGAASAAGAAGWWTIDADGTNEAILVPSAAIGLSPDELAASHPVLQPFGGAPVRPLPWSPGDQIAVGPPAPTPAPTPLPELGPGFTWSGAASTRSDDPFGETATLLRDGRVLVADACGTGAELLEASAGSFSATGSLTATRAGHTATLLRDGRVLFVGGYNCARAGEDGIWASAELYDPATGTFSATGSMSVPREFHTATLLGDGRVLIAGGLSGSAAVATGGITLASVRTAESSSSVLATAEVYDPVTGTFSRTGSMATFRDHHTATLLPDGRVLVTGGGGEGYASSTSAEVYDPVTGRFAATGAMRTGRWLHTATLLPDGRVLVLGGRSPKDSVYDSAETFDPAAGRFSAAGTMGEGRQEHTATLLGDGRVLITGGSWSDGQKWRVLSSAEMYDPGSRTFGMIGSIGTPRLSHTAILLPDGRALIIGGTDIGDGGAVGVGSAVIYGP